MPPPPSDRSGFASRLLDWYGRHHRDLPWRVPPDEIARGARPAPYRVWLSEIMLQQTTVPAVKPYFESFTSQWPGVAALAAAEEADVMKAWAGLGYYARARNLIACARAVSGDHGGRFPETADGLRALPGIGEYTSAAIASIAFGEPVPVVDGNVERVMTRYLADPTPLPAAKAVIREWLQDAVPGDRPGDFAQAMMDLGATICTPKNPACMHCPLRDDCRALGRGEDPLRYPVKPPKAQRPLRHGAAYVIQRQNDGAVLLERRPARGLLGGMAGLPGSNWTARLDGTTGTEDAPLAADWQAAAAVSHVFTHFELRLHVWRAVTGNMEAPDGMWWAAPETISGEALPSVMKKAIEAAIPGATRKKGRA